MKKTFLALLLVGILSLTGCTSMLERDKLFYAPYSTSSSSSSGLSALRVETYQDLVNAILQLVSAGEEHGVIALHNYNAQDVEPDLTRACLEVVQEDPLGAYIVDYIKHDFSLIVSYYEANIHITYRHSPEQVASIVSVTGSSAIRRELRKTLTSFAPQAVLQVSYFAEDENYIQELVRQAYYDAPVAALGMPEVAISLYPSSGTKRIIQIDLAYPDTQENLRLRSQELKQFVLSVAPQATTAQEMYHIVADDLALVESSAQNSAYDALISRSTNSEGAALAYQLLCDQTSVESIIVQGTLNNAPHFWNIVTEDGNTYRHVDTSTGLFLLTDDQLLALEPENPLLYDWDRSLYPICSP